MIVSAENASQEDRLKELLDGIRDDFDYAIDGLYMLSRNGVQDTDTAVSIAHELQSQISDIIQRVASATQSVGE